MNPEHASVAARTGQWCLKTVLNGTIVKCVVTPRSHNHVLQPLPFKGEPWYCSVQLPNRAGVCKELHNVGRRHRFSNAHIREGAWCMWVIKVLTHTKEGRLDQCCSLHHRFFLTRSAANPTAFTLGCCLNRNLVWSRDFSGQRGEWVV